MIRVSDRFRRIGAWAGILILLGLYILTLVSALLSSEKSAGLFVASLYSTFVVPLWIFLLQLFYRKSHPEGSVGIQDIRKHAGESPEEPSNTGTDKVESKEESR